MANGGKEVGGKRRFVPAKKEAQWRSPGDNGAAATAAAEQVVRLRSHARAGTGIPQRQEDDAWITTYLDVLTLLLTFLVIMIAYANYDDPGAGVADVLDVFEQTLAPTTVEEPAAAAVALADDVRLAVASSGLAGEVDVDPDTGDVRLRLSGDLAFSPGSADLTPAAVQLVARVARILFAGTASVSVEGHTDDIPIATARFPSNWHLSAARAGTVVQALVAGGVGGDRLRAIGYGETRPIAGNDLPGGRAQNRRVTITIHNRGTF